MRTRAGLSQSQQANVIARDGGVEGSSTAVLRLHVVDVPADQVGRYLKAYQTDPDVESADKDWTREAQGAPDDAAYGQQWALPRIGWDQAYGKVTPSGQATIAVLDTGVQSSDVSLAGGFSAISSDPTVDPTGHGTWLASIAAAKTNNGNGIAGVAYDRANVMPVQVLDANGLGQDSDIIAGIVYAADHGADVILMGFSNPAFSAALHAAVEYAWSKGAVLVAATGNGGSSTPTYPAGDAKVIGVSATDQSDELWGGSNYGVDTFIGAPGVGIEADAVGGGTTSVTGTSASAAIVAGAAALIRAADPSASNGAIVGRLARNADQAGTSDETGNGRVNIGRAVQDTVSDPVTPAGTAGGSQLGGSDPAPVIDVSAVYDPSTTTIKAKIHDANATKLYNVIYTPPPGGGSDIRHDCLIPGGTGGNVRFTDSLVLPAGFATGEWTITVEEINSGQGCAGSPNRRASASTTVSITDVTPAGITVTKTADPTSLAEPGGDFAFSVNVHNDSTVDTVTIDTLSDDLYGDLDGLGTCSVPQIIAPGADYGCSFTGSFLGSAGDRQTDTVTASGTDDDNAPVSATGKATVSITDVTPRNPIVIIVMENKSASDVLGNANAPYLNAFYEGGQAFTNYREGDNTGPSLPDYLQMAAGSSCGSTDDSVVPGKFGSGQRCPTTVWNQLDGVGASWGVYMDAMPTACSSEVTYQNPALDTPYALKHNPATPFDSIWSDQALCLAHVLPYTSFHTTNMPDVSFIAPGICNDQHGSPKLQADGVTPLYQDCYPDSPELMKRGDDWLAARVPAMLAAGATVFITYDESGVLYAAEQGPGIPSGTTDSTAYTHYSLLAAIEDRFGLAKLGGAQSADVIPI